MPRDRFDESVRRRQPKTMNDDLRAAVIMDLRRKGWTYKAIGQRVGLSANGAKYALHRVTQPGRYDVETDGEVDVEPPEKW
jgi:lambda repressor-like predicted transcriptional regulator